MAAFLIYGSLFLLGGIVLLIHVWLAWWIAFLITGGAVSAAGVLFLMTMMAAARAKSPDRWSDIGEGRDRTKAEFAYCLASGLSLDGVIPTAGSVSIIGVGLFKAASYRSLRTIGFQQVALDPKRAPRPVFPASRPPPRRIRHSAECAPPWVRNRGPVRPGEAAHPSPASRIGRARPPR
jgi:hypothetical protein